MPRPEHADLPEAGNDEGLAGEAHGIDAEIVRLNAELAGLRDLLASERAMFEAALSEGAAELGLALDGRDELATERDRLRSTVAKRTQELEQARARVRDQRERLTQQRDRITRLRERLEQSESEVARLRASPYRRARSKVGSLARRTGLRR